MIRSFLLLKTQELVNYKPLIAALKHISEHDKLHVATTKHRNGHDTIICVTIKHRHGQWGMLRLFVKQ